MNRTLLTGAAAAVLVAVAPVVNADSNQLHSAVLHGSSTARLAAHKTVTLPDGLKYVDLVVGKGARPTPGQQVTVNYVGTLTNGTKFDASADHGGTFTFTIGEGQVIKGWDEGVMSMRVGGKRKLICPPDLAYGANSPSPAIPPNSTLVFTIDLISVK